MKRTSFLGLLFIVTFYHGCYTQEYFNDKTALDVSKENGNWMKDIDENIELSKLFIPGTHDSLALYGGPAAECQSWKLETQLKAGIRYFDLRVWNIFDKPKHMVITHGPVIQFYRLSSVFKDMVDFLTQHPSETILIRIKPENTFKTTVMDHTLTLLKELKYENFVYPSLDNRDSQPMAKLKEVRCKIVFMRLENGFQFGIPFQSTHQKGEHKVSSSEDKLEMVLNYMNNHMSYDQASDEEVLDLILTYSSGTGWPKGKIWISPKKVAEKINPSLAENLAAFQTERVFHGIIAMDFPGPDLIKHVIDQNPHQPKQSTSNGKRSLKRGKA